MGYLSDNVSCHIQWRMEFLLSPLSVINVFVKKIFCYLCYLLLPFPAGFLPFWFSLCVTLEHPSILPNLPVPPSKGIRLFSSLSLCKNFLFIQARNLPHQLILWHTGMAWPCAFKIFPLRGIWPPWIPLPFRQRTVSQETLPTNVLNSPKSVLQIPRKQSCWSPPTLQSWSHHISVMVTTQRLLHSDF